MKELVRYRSRMPIGLALLCVVAGGCQYGAGPFDPLGRALARRDVKRGDLHLRAGRADDAVRAYRQAIAHDARSAAAHARLGACLSENARDAEASKHFAEAVRFDPDNVDHALRLAGALSRAALISINRTERLEAAIRAYRHAASLEPDSMAAALGLAEAHYHLGDFSTAAESLERARRIEPTSTRACVRLGETYEAMLMVERALAQYQDAIRLAPDSAAEGHAGCGRVNFELGRRMPDNPIYQQRAVAHLRRSLELDGNQPRIRAMLRNSLPPILDIVTAAQGDE